LPNMPWCEDPGGDGETIHLHCTDVDGEWVATLAPTGLEVERAHAKADVAARGSASDLLCWVMGRGPIDPLEIFGDRPLLERWRDASKF
jgi:predicted lipid carrier protein YhbT